ncbi:RING/FYVE/PHD zinc finger superfamily protein, putative isoform 2 [Hibiscus syriacus]|uniref:RING/FYVE/PHD zinc finger superfamily protein, putative isoform 2 n=1 Tax=Hibiscus syriacus TaxID=106335 RepID=A0A6A3C981_HIBSY|nr:uncharacterized protein LOC120202039 [Hibiscus syriacus]XP_039058459.1 uncharacterized protein LOC120202039 [Hibiscus syriacus]KAE8725810.1 RING/FYVE/PHD zinc finger superfamily protein, putative isoform 2 [Hibiscus syriacus]
MDRLGPISGHSSSGPPVLWQWIIEYLSSFPEIDTSIITSLIETSPVAPENFNENTNERVALKCLEELFGPENSHGNVVPPVSRATFPPSLSCDAVLNQIMEEVPFQNLKRAAPELSRWDGHSFIKHKRDTLPQCSLEKLKDSILEDDPVTGCDENGPPSWSDDDDKNGNQEGNLIPQINENYNELLLGKDLLPSKRCRDDLVAGNPMGVVSINHGSLHNYLQLNAKKSKQDATPSCTIQSVEELPVHLHADSEELEDESQRIMKVTEIEANNLGKDSQIGVGDKDLWVASRTHGPIDAVGRVELLDNQMENVQNDDAYVMIEHKYGDITCQNVATDESNLVENGALQKGPGGDVGVDIDQDFTLSTPNSISADGLQKNIDNNLEKADIVHPCPEEIFEFEDEILNNALKKNHFLSSHRIPSQDPVQKVGWTEQRSCVKCNQNGNVLVCSGSRCPLVVHESCLNYAARFDDKGNFLCPFCVYSVSISKYLKAKDKIILARKNLVAFMGIIGKLAQERRRFQSHSTLNGNEGLVGIRESEHLGREREHQHQSKLKSCDDHPTTENTETDPVNQVEVERDDILKEAVKPETTDVRQELVNSDGEGSCIGADDKFIISSNTKESQTKFLFPTTRQSKRKIIPWTNAEEGMLRKGVEEFTKGDGTIPWKRILEFGSKVFPRDKTARDLKNKWNSMRKGSMKLQQMI